MSNTDSKGGTRFCISVSLEAMMKRGPAALANMLIRPDGTKLTGPEVYAKCWEAWLEGREVFSPACDNQDEKGNCLGHPIGKGAK